LGSPLRLVGLLFVFMCVSPGFAAADQLWQVNIDITLQGNSSCGGPCVQTIDVSFLYDGQFDQNGGWVFSVVPGSANITGSGPLGSSFTTPGPGFDLYNEYLPIYGMSGAPVNGNVDELDIFRPSVGNTPVLPSFSGTAIYTCASLGCFDGFAQPGTDPSSRQSPNDFGYPFWVIQDETSFTYTVKAVAEPSTLLILLSGLTLVASLSLASRRT